MNTDQNHERPETRSLFSIQAGPAALAAAGALLAVLPHLVNLFQRDSLEYLADGDQLLYMGWSRDAALKGTNSLVDAVHSKSGPMMHPWLLFIPEAWVAHQFKLGITGLNILWRCLGGAGVGLGLYLAMRSVVRDRRLALGVATILLFEAGLLFGQPIFRQLDALQAVLRSTGVFFESVPRVMAHLRVVPPALAIPFFLAHLGAVASARAWGGRKSLALAGITCGLLFHTYFYFWTTAIAALAVAFVLDPKGRKLYAVTAVTGLLIGLPAVIDGARVKAAYPIDWLHRTDKFVKIGRFDELLLPKLNIVVWLLTTHWVFKRRPELIYWWAIVGTGFACTNSQIVTQLQIENFHWLYAPGIALSLLLATWGASFFDEGREQTGEPDRPRNRLRWLSAAVALQVIIGFGLRAAEATRSAETIQWTKVAESLRGGSHMIPDGAVIAGDREGVMLLAASREIYPLSGKFLEYCAEVKDDELDERIVLNLFLLGLDADEARAEVKKPAGTLSWEAEATRSKPLAETQETRRLKLIEAIWSNPAPVLAKFGVTHVLERVEGPRRVDRLAEAGFSPTWLNTSKPWRLWTRQAPPTKSP